MYHLYLVAIFERMSALGMFRDFFLHSRLTYDLLPSDRLTEVIPIRLALDHLIVIV